MYLHLDILLIVVYETHTNFNSFETVVSQVKWIIQASAPIPASMIDSNFT